MEERFLKEFKQISQDWYVLYLKAKYQSQKMNEQAILFLIKEKLGVICFLIITPSYFWPLIERAFLDCLNAIFEALLFDGHDQLNILRKLQSHQR